MGIYGGLKQEDWEHWGQFTTFKQNAAELVAREVRGGQKIYCSPLVDPYQPVEEGERAMPAILDAMMERPPALFVIQTRGPLVLRDVGRLRELGRHTTVRVSFSITTNREDVRQLYEPHCPSYEERVATVRALRSAGIETYATLAPLLPCDAEDLARAAVEASGRDLVGDPLHVRSVKPRGATTRDPAFRIAYKQGHQEWLESGFQEHVILRIRRVAQAAGKDFRTGPEGFRTLVTGATSPG